MATYLRTCPNVLTVLVLLLVDLVRLVLILARDDERAVALCRRGTLEVHAVEHLSY